ncbi:uncharacterized protein LOC62_07G009506 [Vanrija pseudolonga]|uniref:Uncharacterized protein n=1 Tax=Vanrija pseudolonga TaxID=143232 RepID=A0AAF0YM23_9TREE|nr:hypothetical protein LOC62_07G009506 [Vanrija pseudolonga]
MSKPGAKLEKALEAWVDKLQTMDHFRNTEVVREFTDALVFAIPYDWVANGSPGPRSERGDYEPMFTVLADEGKFELLKDAPPKGLPVSGIMGHEDDLVAFITSNDKWAAQNLDKWEAFGGSTQDAIGWKVDALTWSAYQVDGDKGIKAQAAALPLVHSKDDFYEIYYGVRRVWGETAKRKAEFLKPFKGDEIIEYAIQGEEVDPVRLRINLKDGAVTFNPPKDNKATYTFFTDDETFHTVLKSALQTRSDEAFAAKKISVKPAPKNKAERGHLEYIYKHLDLELGFYKGST